MIDDLRSNILPMEAALLMMRRSVGRPPVGEPADDKYPVKLKPSTLDALRLRKEVTGVPIGTQLRELVETGLRRLSSDEDDLATDVYMAPLLAVAPCGPFAEAIRDTRRITFSRELQRLLEMQEGDVCVRCVGESMEGAGIPDGAYLVMRPLMDGTDSLPGEIALVQIALDDGQYQSTIKRFYPATVDKPPVLKDGAGKLVSLPKGVQIVRPVAVARGIIAQIR